MVESPPQVERLTTRNSIGSSKVSLYLSAEISWCAAKLTFTPVILHGIYIFNKTRVIHYTCCTLVGWACLKRVDSNQQLRMPHLFVQLINPDDTWELFNGHEFFHTFFAQVFNLHIGNFGALLVSQGAIISQIIDCSNKKWLLGGLEAGSNVTIVSLQCNMRSSDGPWQKV